MEQILILIGSTIFGVLGTAHLIFTFFTTKLHPRDPTTVDAMKSGTLNLTRQTTVWHAWVGFNASHSLGAMLFAGIYIPLSISHFELISQSPWFSGLPVLVGFSYLLLAKKYWFRIPFSGILLASACFLAAALLINT